MCFTSQWQRIYIIIWSPDEQEAYMFFLVDLFIQSFLYISMNS